MGELIAELTAASQRLARDMQGRTDMSVKINVEPTVIVDELLDTLGREWASDHVKGQNEWWKNSIDQYIHDVVPTTSG